MNDLITLAQWEHNTAALNRYLQENNMTCGDLEIKMGLCKGVISHVLNGLSKGSIQKWKRIAAYTGIEIQYDIEIPSVMRIKNNVQDKFITDYIEKHLKEYGNVYVNPKRVKRYGGAKTLLDVLKKHGFNCELIVYKTGREVSNVICIKKTKG